MYRRVIKQFLHHTKKDLPGFCKRKGLNYDTVRTWRRESSNPTLKTFVKALDKCGLMLIVVEKKEMYKH